METIRCNYDKIQYIYDFLVRDEINTSLLIIGSPSSGKSSTQYDAFKRMTNEKDSLKKESDRQKQQITDDMYQHIYNFNHDNPNILDTNDVFVIYPNQTPQLYGNYYTCGTKYIIHRNNDSPTTFLEWNPLIVRFENDPVYNKVE